jgi:uncharacterized protein
MAQQPVLAVKGEAVFEVEPDVARIEVSVAAVDGDRTRTLRLLTERAAAVAKVLDGFPDVVERTEASAIRVSPQLAGQAGPDRAPGYHGAVYHAITVTGFDRLGELMAQLGDQELAQVGGPWWELRPGSPAYRRVRVAAVRDAVRRARDYAAALGSELVGLIELADARLLSDSRGQAEALTPSKAGLPHRVRAAAPADQVVVGLVPARQVVRATVEARFTIREPDLAAVNVG